MKYYRGWVTLPLESQIKVGEPNKHGNAEVLIPCWLIKKSGIDFNRIREISGFNGEDPVVER